MFINQIRINSSNNNIQLNSKQTMSFGCNKNMLGFDPKDLVGTPKLEIINDSIMQAKEFIPTIKDYNMNMLGFNPGELIGASKSKVIPDVIKSLKK